MYYILEFEGKASDIAPESWVSRKNDNSCVCVWPSCSSFKVPKLIKDKAVPEDSWQPYSARVLGTASTYEKAIYKRAKSVNESDLGTTDAENPKKRIRRRKKIVISSDDSDDSIIKGIVIKVNFWFDICSDFRHFYCIYKKKNIL